MLELIKELLEREWEFEMQRNDEVGVYALVMILGNGCRMCCNDKDAEELLEEIKMYW